jgi:predicted transglutaminase-like cysteine proteinase
MRRAACLFVLSLAGLVTGGAWPDEAGIVLAEKVLAGAERKYGADARKRLFAWEQLIAHAKGRPEPEKLVLVNDFFNRIPFLSDAAHWEREDYWATPVEMLASNGGDCEDFSIAKYFTLAALGVPVDKLKITYVRARMLSPGNQAHMVLAYYATPAAIPAVLDNLVPEIRPASLRPDLTPVYSFNGDGLWLARERGDGKPVAGGSGNIGFWRELKARMGKEFQ